MLLFSRPHRSGMVVVQKLLYISAGCRFAIILNAGGKSQVFQFVKHRNARNDA